jgi:predicted DNA-binding transcriptional regulator YafY
MNKGVAFTTKDIAKECNCSERTALYKIKLLQEKVLTNLIVYEKPHWKARVKFFLNYLNISSERIVTIAGILSLKSHFGEEFSGVISEMMNDLQRDALLLHDHQQVLEKLSSTSNIQLKRLLSAIEDKCKVIFKFDGYQRKVQPYKIINREYYWYLVGYEEEKIDIETNISLSGSQKIKTYTIAKIKAVDIIEEEVSYDFQTVDEILKYASNGYIDWTKEPRDIQVMVHDKLDDYIKRARFYNNWEKVAPSATEGFTLYKVKSVHRQYQDVIPTILKHIPDVIVVEPIELVHIIDNMILQYRAATNFRLETVSPSIV